MLFIFLMLSYLESYISEKAKQLSIFNELFTTPYLSVIISVPLHSLFPHLPHRISTSYIWLTDFRLSVYSSFLGTLLFPLCYGNIPSSAVFQCQHIKTSFFNYEQITLLTHFPSPILLKS